MAVLAEPASLVTAEDLDRMTDEGRSFEIVDGVLVEVPPVGALESRLASRICQKLENYIDSGKLSGAVFDGTVRFRLQRDPDLVRGPDVSFVRADRLPSDSIPSGHVNVAPDLAVEIVSESHPSPPIEPKIAEYLEAGVKMVWVIYPKTRTAYLYTSAGSVRRIGESGELDGGEAVPGFRLPLGKLFEAVAGKAKS